MGKSQTLKSWSPIRYFGGKFYLASTLISMMPAHKRYIEVFGGGGHVLAQKEPTEFEVYNDIDRDLINFLNVMKKDSVRLQEALRTIPTSRYLLEKWRNEPLPEHDPFEWATRWFFLLRQRITPSNATLKSGWRAGKIKNLAFDYQNSITRIDSFAKRLKDVNVTNLDFRLVIEKYDDSESLFFIDPPYVEREHYYKGGFTMQDHIDLAQSLYFIQGKAIVTYYSHPVIESLYAGWNRYEVEAVVGSGIARNGAERRRENEIIFTNFDLEKEFSQTELF